MKKIKKILCLVIAVVIMSALFTGIANADALAYGAATVKADRLNVREGMSTDTPIVGVISQLTKVVVLEKSSSEWYKINYHGLVGYVSTEFLDEVVTVENFTASGTVTGDSVRTRMGNSVSKPVVATLNKGDKVDVVGINNGWYKIIVDGKFSYIRSDFLSITGASVSGRTNSSGAKTLGEQVVEFALQFEGYAYTYGGTSPSTGFDCSGFAQYCYAHVDRALSRTASQQYRDNGTKIEKSELQPGDLLFFAANGRSISHVGIYIGDGHFIHASTSNTGVIISDLYSDYYLRVYYSAKHID